jgi:hypothetical protein
LPILNSIFEADSQSITGPVFLWQATRMLVMKLLQEAVEKTALRDSVNPDPQLTSLAVRFHAGRLDGVVKDIDCLMDLLDEDAARFSQLDPACIPVEDDNSKVFLQRSDPRTHARLANAKRLCCTLKAEVFGDSKRLNEDDHWETTTTQRGQGDRLTGIFAPLSPPHAGAAYTSIAGTADGFSRTVSKQMRILPTLPTTTASGLRGSRRIRSGISVMTARRSQSASPVRLLRVRRAFLLTGWLTP